MNPIEQAARAAIGSRFRLHGREPATGLDCVGLVAVALRGGGFVGEVPAGYALRGGDPVRVGALLAMAGLTPVKAHRPGDVLLVRTGPGQLHLVIASQAGVIHADAGLRRVVERPGAVGWPIVGAWRLDAKRGD